MKQFSLITHRFACQMVLFFFFFKDPAPTEISTLPLHAALPICRITGAQAVRARTEIMDTYRRLPILDPQLPASLLPPGWLREPARDLFTAVYDGLTEAGSRDRKSTRLNSSHLVNSYALFCLKKKKPIADRFAIPHTPLSGRWGEAASTRRRRLLG